MMTTWRQSHAGSDTLYLGFTNTDPNVDYIHLFSASTLIIYSSARVVKLLKHDEKEFYSTKHNISVK